MIFGCDPEIFLQIFYLLNVLVYNEISPTQRDLLGTSGMAFITGLGSGLAEGLNISFTYVFWIYDTFEKKTTLKSRIKHKFIKKMEEICWFMQF